MLSSIAVDCKWQGTGCSLVVWGTLLHPFLLVKVLMTDVLLEEGKTKFTQIQSCSQSVYGKEANHSQWSFWTLVDHWYITCFFHTWWSCMKLRTDNVTAIYYINWQRNMSPTLLKKKMKLWVDDTSQIIVPVTIFLALWFLFQMILGDSWDWIQE